MNETFKKLDPARQAALLDDAAAVFAERGFAATVEEICARAGISNGALYKYFNGKEALYEAVMERGIGIIRSMYAAYGASPLPPYDTLRAIFGDIGPLVKKNSSYVSIYLDLGTTAMNRFAKKYSRDLENVGRDFIAAMLERAMREGTVPSGLDLPAAVFLIDTLIVLYAYSFVSEHYRRRLDGFIGLQGKGRVTEDTRIEFMMRAVAAVLGIREP